MSTDTARRVPKATPAGPDGLTDRQRQILTMVYESARDRGFQPTMREIGVATGSVSANSVFGHLRALQRKGWIRLESYENRAIRILRTPSGATFRGFQDKGN